jgi:queuine tRNA-ribosyltransferase
MPVGTYGTVKAMTPEELERSARKSCSATPSICICARPRGDRGARGLHRFMHWQRPILTDSGGFQVWSLAEMRKITEEGASFRSPVDGAPVFLSPEESMRIQRVLGSDIAMSFDECTPYPATEAEARASMELSMRWAARGFREYYEDRMPPGTLFGIVQGGVYAACAWRRWRRSRRSASRVSRSAASRSARARPSAIGARGCCRRCRVHKPRYLMGVGGRRTSSRRCRRGIDMFDCVMPTRHARNAHLFTRTRRVNIRNAAHQKDTARSRRVRLLYLPQLQPQLPAPPRQVRRNPRRAPQHDPQPVFLPAPDARDSAAIEAGRFEAYAAEFYALGPAPRAGRG